MPSNHVLLRRIELGDSAASVTLNNLPQSGYTDLKVVVSARSSRANPTDTLFMRFNGTSTTYTNRRLYGFGTTTGSDGGTAGAGFDVGAVTASTATANTFSNCEIYVPNFLGGSTKSISLDTVAENNASAGNSLVLSAGLWSGTAAITSITFQCDVGTLVAGSSFAIYGVASVDIIPEIAPKASGGSVYSDGTYYYHVFRGSGYFTPNKALTCDILQVAGGGGGGYGGAGTGGGGAGGLLGFTGQSLTSSVQYPVAVGSGGSGGTATNGTQGNGSQFAALTASVGGGFGGGSYQTAGVTGGNGGSGGGAGAGNTGTNWGQSGGMPTSGQGFAGGVSESSGGGGGGGASQAGGATVSGKGGNGVSTYSTWGSATSSGQNVSGTFWFAGGGGGSKYEFTQGLGGSGGGGNSGVYGSAVIASSGIANTGGGGGGGGYALNIAGAQLGGNGGSGIVIIRYPMNA